MSRAPGPRGEGRVRAGRARAADEIVGRCRERLDRGEPVDPESVVREHPDLARLLRPRLEAMLLLHDDGAKAADAPRRSLAGAAIGPYRLVAELGAGGMGTVYEARAERGAPGLDAGARVAFKVIHPELFPRRGYAERFRREADLGRRVRQENVVRTLDAGEALVAGAQVRFLVMEFVEGRTLAALAEEFGRVPEELCRHIGREVAKALAAIHAAGAVHRDVKPDNVLITSEHAVKLMDFGVARLVDDAARLSQTGAFVGSIKYAAPEQLAPAPRSSRGAKGGPHVDHRTDLHALGLLLYELSTGEHPFEAAEFGAVVRNVLDRVPRRAGAANPQLSPFFEELLAQLLEKERDRRPASAGAAARILEEGEDSAWWKERAGSLRRETRRPLRRIRIPRETALHGRERDLTVLRSLYAQAAEGHGCVALIEGEAGIGKSRLVDEFVGRLAQAGDDVSFLFGSYPPGGAATSSGAFATAYREHLGDDDAAIREALPQTPLLVPAFAALLRGDVAPEHAEKLTKDSLQTVFVHATRAFAARRTTIVFIDDLHFAPEEGRALFASLALAVPGHRIMLIGGARPTLDEKWVGSLASLPHLTRVPLARLGARDLVALLLDALKSQHLAEELAGKIATKSDGNPFFVFEILRTLRDGKYLTKTADGTWITTKEIREIDVPPSVVEVIQARVAELSREDRDILDVAACVGFEFDAALVGDVLHLAPIPLLQRLGQIEKRHRLVRSVGRRFAFDHHQVQEVLYAGLTDAVRETHHARIAEVIETRSGAASANPSILDGGVCVDLAEHFLRGSTGERALRYLDAALKNLDVRYLEGDAIRLARRALGTPALVTGQRRCELLLTTSSRLGRLGLMSDQSDLIEQARAIAFESGDTVLRGRVLGILGFHLRRVSRFDDAQRVLDEAVALGRTAGDRQGEAHAEAALGHIFFSLARYHEARPHYERSLALSREAGFRSGEANAHGSLGNVLISLGRFNEALPHHEKCVAISREICDRSGEARAIRNVGYDYQQVGSFLAARAHYERCIELSRELGYREAEGFALGPLGQVLEELGDEAGGRRHHQRCLAVAREIGYDELEAYALYALGVLLERQHASDEATACIRSAAELARRLNLLGVRAVALARLAASGEGGDTVTAALEALSRCEEGGGRVYLTEGHHLLWKATGDRVHLQRAKRHLDQLIDHAPPEYRESILTNVRLHREIAQAAREHGIA